MSTAILWLRRDLRLQDNPALAAACARHARLVPVYIHAPHEEAPWEPGAASNWWLHHALEDLDRQLGGRLVVREGDSLAVLQELITRTGAQAVYWNRLYEPALIARDTTVKQALRSAGIEAVSHNAALWFEPWEVANKQGAPFRVFTPFWRHLLARGLPDRPVEGANFADRLASLRQLAPLGGGDLASLRLLPQRRWDVGIADAWVPTRAAAEGRLQEFLATDLRHYPDGRDRPAAERVSRLSPYLHFGQLGPREVSAACRGGRHSAAEFLREVGWREFGHHLLYHFPHTADRPLDTRFEQFAWRTDDRQLHAWQRGQTGIPMVDAGMRQLWTTGWMHNRVRMLVASFLTKNLLLPWQHGARWFWDTLVDADLASNTLGWQWTAGCGADAAPYFRVFNPVVQGEKFDPAGDYVRRWIPRLGDLPDRWVHRPWEAPTEVLEAGDVRLGQDYPQPLVDLRATRARALEAWGGIK